MNKKEFVYVLDIFENAFNKVSDWDIAFLEKAVMKYTFASFKNSVNYLIINHNSWNGFSLNDLVKYTYLFFNGELEQIENRGSIMLKKMRFDRQIRTFQNEFNSEYGVKREDLLYSAVNYMTEIEFDKTLIQLLLANNKDALPTVREVTAVAYRIAPEAIRHNQMNPIELKLMA